MVVHSCNPSTQEAESGQSWVWGKPALYNETLSQKQTNIFFWLESCRRLNFLYPSKLYVKTDFQCDSRRWDLWEVIKNGIMSDFFFFFGGGGTGVWPQSLVLDRQALCLLSYASSSWLRLVPWRTPVPLPPCEDTARRQPSMNLEGNPH
jgi:hypothetical protein